MYKIFIVPIIGFALCFGNISFAEGVKQAELRASVSYYDTFPTEDQIPIASVSIRTLLSDDETFDFESERLFVKGKIKRIKQDNNDNETYKVDLNITSKVNNIEYVWGSGTVVLNKGENATLGVVRGVNGQLGGAPYHVLTRYVALK